MTLFSPLATIVQRPGSVVFISATHLLEADPCSLLAPRALLVIWDDFLVQSMELQACFPTGFRLCQPSG